MTEYMKDSMTNGTGEKDTKQLDGETAEKLARRINSVVQSHSEAMQSEIVETITESMNEDKEATHEVAKFGDNLE